MSQCSGCSIDYFSAIAKYHSNNQECFDFLRDHGVLAKEVKCRKCGSDCVLRDDRHQWRCRASTVIPKTKKRRYCTFAVGDYKGTFLQETRLPPWKVVLFVNHWLSKSWNHEIVTECLHISRTTSVQWRAFCSEVTEYWFSNQGSIGGPGSTVEIDETIIVKKEYETDNTSGQVWLFGGIERGSKKSFIVPVVGPLGEAERRDKGTLIPIIQQYIQPGTVIISDQWGSNGKLGDLGYTHHTVKHSGNFVTPSQGDIHTQNIKRLWRDVKEWVKRPGIRSRFLHQYLSRYLFLKAHVNAERLHAFFTYAGQLHPPLSDQRNHPSPLCVHDDTDNNSK